MYSGLMQPQFSLNHFKKHKVVGLWLTDCDSDSMWLYQVLTDQSDVCVFRWFTEGENSDQSRMTAGLWHDTLPKAIQLHQEARSPRQLPWVPRTSEAPGQMPPSVTPPGFRALTLLSTLCLNFSLPGAAFSVHVVIFCLAEIRVSVHLGTSQYFRRHTRSLYFPRQKCVWDWECASDLSPRLIIQPH